MPRPTKLALTTVLAASGALALATAGAAAAAPAGGALFVQNDNPAGNAVTVYDRGPDGALTQAGTYATGGRGRALTGSVVDHLASQDSLAYDGPDRLLFAVNAGSDTISAFAVAGDRLSLRQVVGSGGAVPVSLAVHGDLVYVLNALAGGSVAGYRIEDRHLVAIPGSNRPLGLAPDATPQFTSTPGDVAFTPDGRDLLVTTKAGGNSVDVFAVEAGGLLASAPVVNAEPGAVPFAIAFDPAGHVDVAEAGTNTVASFELGAAGTLAPLSAVATGQAATCWLAADGSLLFAGNAGSGDESTISAGAGGALSLLATTPTDAGTVDAVASPDGRFLYVQTGKAGIVDAFRVGDGGALTAIGSVTVPDGAGGEGIAAS